MGRRRDIPIKNSRHQTQLVVAIVTKNRATALKRCLESLAVQTVLPLRLIVIDNCSTDNTAQVIKDFAVVAPFPVQTFKEKKIGYPMVYNTALRKCQAEWLVFIDDDCVADPSWLEAYHRAVQQWGKTTQALVGRSETIAPATIWSLAVLAADQFWKHSVVDTTGRVTDLETLDNKNVAYFVPFLQQHGLCFNEAAVAEPGLGAAEDADLGMQLAQAGAKARFLSQACIWHADPNHAHWYYHRLLFGAIANHSYQRRWGKVRVSLGLDTRRARRFAEFWPVFCQKQHLAGWKAHLVWLIVQLSFVWVKMLQRRWWQWSDQVWQQKGVSEQKRWSW